MAGPASHASRPLPYSGTPAVSPCCRNRLRLAAIALVLSLGSLNGGCAVSGMFGASRDDAMAQADVTGSIPHSKLSTGLPPEADLRLARSAITEVLGMGRKDFSTSWENPATGARGTVTPIAGAYQQDGATCHDFLASHIDGRTETWMRGEACQQPQGRWEVRALKPWKRT